MLNSLFDNSMKGWVITAKCKNIPKLLSALDYMYSDEGGRLKMLGLTKEQGADTDPVYIKAGMTEGAYWFEDGKLVQNPLPVLTKSPDSFCDYRLPGLSDEAAFNQVASPKRKEEDRWWIKYRDTKIQKLSSALSYPIEDENKMNSASAAMTDYISTSVPKFIVGTTTLNDQTWAEYRETLRNLGVDEILRIRQAAYDRWLKR
jgi:putative aldouronate transport system substrate-binding protein